MVLAPNSTHFILCTRNSPWEFVNLFCLAFHACVKHSWSQSARTWLQVNGKQWALVKNIFVIILQAQKVKGCLLIMFPLWSTLSKIVMSACLFCVVWGFSYVCRREVKIIHLNNKEKKETFKDFEHGTKVRWVMRMENLNTLNTGILAEAEKPRSAGTDIQNQNSPGKFIFKK